MRPMDREFIEQHDIAQRYLHGRLTPEEAEEFEVYLMDNPEMVEEFELDSLFKTYASSRSFAKNSVAWLSNKKHWLSGFVSSALTFVACAFMFVTLTPTEINNSPAYWAQVIYLESKRGDSVGQAFDIQLPANQGALAIVFAPEQTAFSSFDVILADEQSRPIHQFKGVKRSNLDELTLVVPQSSVKPGEYQLVINPEGQLSASYKQIISLNVRGTGGQ